MTVATGANEIVAINTFALPKSGAAQALDVGILGMHIMIIPYVVP